MDASGRSSLYIEFWYKDHNVPPKGAMLKFYNGTKWIDIADLGSTNPENTWHQFKTTVTDPQFMTANLKVKFELSSFDGTKDLYIDELTVAAAK